MFNTPKFLSLIHIFILHMDVAGAALATALSNIASVVFFAIQYLRLKDKTAVSLHPRYFTFRFMRPIFSVGLASALATALGNASNMVMLRLASGYGDIPVAAYGIVKRIDQFPLNVSMGLCQGFMPLVGYNFAAKNYNRMRQVSVFSWKTALVTVSYTHLDVYKRQVNPISWAVSWRSILNPVPANAPLPKGQ